MANQIDIKVLIDAADGVKSIGEARKALRDLKSAALQVDEGSKGFQDLTAAAGRLQDRIGDLQQQMNYMAEGSGFLRGMNGLRSVAEGVAGGFALIQGAMTLFGTENEKVQESLLKLNAIMSILNGLTALGNVLQAESAAVLFIQNATRGITIALVGQQAAAEAAEAVAAGTATVAQRALNAAMNANPIGILVGLILAGVTALTLWTGASKKAAEEQKKRKEEAEAEAKALDEENLKLGQQGSEFLRLAFAIKNTNNGSRERKTLIAEVNKTYGTTFKNLEDETAFQNQLNLSIKEYIALQVLKLKQADKEKAAQKAYGELYKLEKERNKVLAEYRGMSEKEISDYDLKTYGVEVYRSSVDRLNFEIDNATKKAEKYTISQKDVEDEIAKLTINGSKYEKQTEKNTKTTEKNTDATDKNAEALRNLNEAYDGLTKLTRDFQAESLSTYLERVKTTLNDEVRIRDVEFQASIKQLEEQKNEEIQKVLEAEAKKIELEAAFVKKKGENDEDYSKRVDTEALKRLKANQKYIDLESAYLILAEEKKRLFLKETTEFINEQLEAQRLSAKEAAEALLSPAQFSTFFKFLTDSSKKANEIAEADFDAIVASIVAQYQAIEDGAKAAEGAADRVGGISSQILNDLSTGGTEINKQLEKLREDAYITTPELLRQLFELNTDNLKNTADAELAYTLKIAAFYQDKFKVIKKLEEDTGKFLFGASQERIDAEVADLKKRAANNELGYTQFVKTAEEGEADYTKRLEAEVKARLNFGIAENEALKDRLEDRYDLLVESEANFFAQQQANIVQQNVNYNKQLTDIQNKGLSAQAEQEAITKLNQDKNFLSNEEYLKALENLQTQHNETLTDIEVAYGKKSFEEVANRRKLDIENKKKADKEKEDLTKEAVDKELQIIKKRNDAYIALEQEVQSAIMELFKRTQEARDRAAQDRYEAEIARIDAEQKKYEDSLANRTLAEQQEQDIKDGFAQQRANAQAVLNQERDAIQRRSFEAQKANEATTVAIQTAVAVAKTIAELGGIGAITPAGIALIAAVVAQGAIQEALILSQQYVPAFATGGLISGPGTGTSDSVLIRASNGESVINARSTRKYAPLLSAINQAEGGAPIGNFANGGMIANNLGSGNLTRLEQLLTDLNNRPIETYVKQTVVENAQNRSNKIKNRTTFG